MCLLESGRRIWRRSRSERDRQWKNNGGLRPITCNVSTPAGSSSLYPYANATQRELHQSDFPKGNEGLLSRPGAPPEPTEYSPHIRCETTCETLAVGIHRRLKTRPSAPPEQPFRAGPDSDPREPRGEPPRATRRRNDDSRFRGDLGRRASVFLHRGGARFGRLPILRRPQFSWTRN